MNTPNFFITRTAILFAAVLGSAAALGQNQATVPTPQVQPETIAVPLSRPGEPISMSIDLLSARIEVIGEERKDVSLTVTLSGGRRKIVTPSGSRTLSGGGGGLEISERDNRVSIESDGPPDRMGIVVRVPRRAQLNLSTVNDGEIIVRDIVGDVELENVNGPITATNINGSVIAESVNAPIVVGLAAVAPGGATSVSSLNGAAPRQRARRDRVGFRARRETEQGAHRAQRAPRRRLGAHGERHRRERQRRRTCDPHQDVQRRHQARESGGLGSAA